MRELFVSLFVLVTMTMSACTTGNLHVRYTDQETGAMLSYDGPATPEQMVKMTETMKTKEITRVDHVDHRSQVCDRFGNCVSGSVPVRHASGTGIAPIVGYRSQEIDKTFEQIRSENEVILDTVSQ